MPSQTAKPKRRSKRKPKLDAAPAGKAEDVDLCVDSLDALGRIVGFSRPTLVGYCRRGLPRRPGVHQRTYRYSLREAVEWLRKHVWVPAVRPESDDPLLDGGDSSPALERYRAARASLAELELATRQGQLLPRAETHQAMARMSALIRTLGETFQRHGEIPGADAAQLLDATLDDFDRELQVLFGERGSGDDDGNGDADGNGNAGAGRPGRPGAERSGADTGRSDAADH
jgi:hypothetical protein